MKNEVRKPARSALGRGLAALISTPVAVGVDSGNLAVDTTRIEFAESQGLTVAPSVSSSVDDEADRGTAQGVRYLDISLVIPNPKQPRQEFKEAEIEELANSIKTLGVLQPILVRPGREEQKGHFEIIAGERRWRAAKASELTQVPVIIKDLADREVLEVALVENIQRSNLSPIEEARAYCRLADEFSLSQKEIAERVGKDRASIANYMRLLNLPEPVIAMLRDGEITMGHAKAILTVKEPTAQIGLARKVISENLSVRALEAIVSRVVVLDGGKRKGEVASADNRLSNSGQSDFPEVTDKLRSSLGTKVSIRHHDSGRGKIEIEYFSEQELDRIVELITR